MKTIKVAQDMTESDRESIVNIYDEDPSLHAKEIANALDLDLDQVEQLLITERNYEPADGFNAQERFQDEPEPIGKHTPQGGAEIRKHFDYIARKREGIERTNKARDTRKTGPLPTTASSYFQLIK